MHHPANRRTAAQRLVASCILEMARPLRREYSGALYHVTARGNERRAIFLGNLDNDRAVFLDTFAQMAERFNCVCHAYRLMTNHYHLLSETPDSNLSKERERGQVPHCTLQHPGIARCVKPEDSEKLTDALREMLAKVGVENRRRNSVARVYAEEYLDEQQVPGRFEADFTRLVAGGSTRG